MRLLGFFLLLAGWSIVIAALAVIGSGVSLEAFILCGAGVEVLGLIMVVRSHLIPQGDGA